MHNGDCKMKLPIALTVAFFMWTGSALACEIEEWNYSHEGPFFEVFGVATCERGRIGIRLYDGEGENRKLLDVGEALIGSYVFKALFTLSKQPKALSVKFSVNNQF